MSFTPLHLSDITDEQLDTLMLVLELACGRSHQTSRRKREQWYCFLNRVLQTEATLRGLPIPAAPFHAASVPPFAL
jgi:hypothetical protein